MEDILIRPISAQDDTTIANVIRTALLEFDAPEEGSALGDSELEFMSQAFSEPRSVYFVAEENGKIIGGAGIAPLEEASPEICELRKMYLAKKARGKGIGKLLMRTCLKSAREFGFEKCYIETFSTMGDAQKLYVASGFYYLNAPKGNTGHTACTVWMEKDLSDAD